MGNADYINMKCLCHGNTTKPEKLRLLVVLNKDVDAKRAAEEDVYRMALGKDISFEDYLRGDKDFNKAMADKKKGI